MRRCALTLVMLLLCATATSACANGPTGPQATAQAFLSAFGDGDFDGAAGLTDQPSRARPALQQAWAGLQAQSLDAHTAAVRIKGDSANVGYKYAWSLPKARTWTYTGDLLLGRRGNAWVVRWSGTNIHPKLGDTQTLALRSTSPPRARVNERSGTDVLVPGTTHAISFNVADAGGEVTNSATRLVNALQQFNPGLSAQSLVESASSLNGDYQVMTLGDREYSTVAAMLDNVAGITVSSQADLVPTDRNFAPDLISQVRDKVVNKVDGSAGWEVYSSNSNGAEMEVLTESAAKAAPSIALSLDRQIQNAAQAAVDHRVEQAMMVVIQPSTGAILAVAQNKEADKDGPVSTTGQFPPGSTFKIVTAGAAIDRGLAAPDSMVPCPGRIDIGERSIPNYDEFALGTVSMELAFARSCNTSFAKLASQMNPDDLHKAASAFGLGNKYSVEGLPTETGSVPVTGDLVQRSENGFGQGLDVVSPFGMALVAATVQRGSTPVPYLIKEFPTQVELPSRLQADPPHVTPPMVDGLRGMMRTVVTSGTALNIAEQGDVYGKTGEAEVEGGSHAWFVGYRGDLAFATLVVRGGSSDNAVIVTRDMFAALPAGY